MYSELFKIPFTELTVKSYGMMIVIGFLVAVYIARRLSRKTINPELLTNAAIYSLIAGIIGARLFYVIHYFDQFKGNLPAILAIWKGGLELLGGVILAIIVVIVYLAKQKQPIRKYLDIIAIGMLIALAFGRIGCFLNGCCFGKPTNLPFAVRFPYNSDAYRSQVFPDSKRDRSEPQLQLPEDFFDYYQTNGRTFYGLKAYEQLTDNQKQLLQAENKLRSLPVHPTQLYSSAAALVMALLLYAFWNRAQKTNGNCRKFLTADGNTFAMMFILYAPVRFAIEFIRNDNPFEHSWWIIYKGGTISQNISIYMLLLGVVLMIIFQMLNPKSTDT